MDEDLLLEKKTLIRHLYLSINLTNNKCFHDIIDG